MGLIRAALGAVGSTFADQWKEFIYCDAIDNNTLVVKGQKKTKGNNKGNDNIISNGSVIAVNDGQCMIIVEQGKVVELCAEPGEFKYDTSTEPSIFGGSLGQSILDTFKTMGKRFTYGGDTGKDQRVYYFNTKEILGNKYGTANPVPFRVVDARIGLDVDISIRCNGEYSYRIIDPILFYTNVCGNVADRYTKDKIEGQLKSELLTALQPAFARISEMGIRYSAVMAHTKELANALNAELSDQWGDLRGIEIVSFGVNTMKASEEDEQMIKDLQKAATLSNPTMAAGMMTGATADAMKAAASNTATGPMMAFAGMNMANMTGAPQAQNLFAMGGQPIAPPQTQPAPAAAPAQTAGWTCECGQTGNTGKFCSECGKPQPAPAAGWTCSCGAVNQGKFCAECGAKKPAGAPLYKCDKCGWTPEDPANPPKFCPECGDPFDDKDVQ
ncbi:MAG: SPFH domain-containing protein [Lachnospiraceae bacterium]|nr:SPFH domain-containing protein [Lachnospiraceae bacterium]